MKIEAAIGRTEKQYGRGYDFILSVSDENKVKLNRILARVEKKGLKDESYDWQIAIEFEVIE